MADQALIERVTQAQALVEEKRKARERAEARADAFRDRLEEFKQKLREEGLDPAKLDDRIKELEAEIDEDLTKLEQALNGTEEQPAQD